MYNDRMKILIACVLLGLLVSVGTVQAEDGSALNLHEAPAKPVTTCNSCSDCSTKLASEAYALVRLTTDLLNQGGSCVYTLLGESNNIFDCDGHLIDGDDIAIDPDQGIAMLHGSNNTIRNCRVTDFTVGILLHNATNHTVENSWMASNSAGLQLNYASGSTIEGNMMVENYTGIYLNNASSNTLTDNRVCYNSSQDFNVVSSTGNSGSRNQCLIPDGWNDDGATGCEYPCWTCWLHLPLIAR